MLYYIINYHAIFSHIKLNDITTNYKLYKDCNKNLTLIIFIGWFFLFWYNIVSVIFVENCSTPFYNKKIYMSTTLKIP